MGWSCQQSSCHFKPRGEVPKTWPQDLRFGLTSAQYRDRAHLLWWLAEFCRRQMSQSNASKWGLFACFNVYSMFSVGESLLYTLCKHSWLVLGKKGKSQIRWAELLHQRSALFHLCLSWWRFYQHIHSEWGWAMEKAGMESAFWVYSLWCCEKGIYKTRTLNCEKGSHAGKMAYQGNTSN